MSDIITTLHPQGDNVTNLYPNVKLENIVDTTPEDSGKVLGIGEDGKVKPVTVDIPEPVQVNDSRITLTQGGVEKGFFTLNQAEDATIELDAGGSTKSKTNGFYTCTDSITKGQAAYTSARQPIETGDVLSSVYFNTSTEIIDFSDVLQPSGDGSVPIVSGKTMFNTLNERRVFNSGDTIDGLYFGQNITQGQVISSFNEVINTIGNESSGYKTLVEFSDGSVLRIVSENAGVLYYANSSDNRIFSYSTESGMSINIPEGIYKFNSPVTVNSTYNYTADWNNASIVSEYIEDIEKPLFGLMYIPSMYMYNLESVWALVDFMKGGDGYPIYLSEALNSDSSEAWKKGWQKDVTNPFSLGNNYSIIINPDYTNIVNKLIGKTDEWVNHEAIPNNIAISEISVGDKELQEEDIILDNKQTLAKIVDFRDFEKHTLAVKDRLQEGYNISGKKLYINTDIKLDLSEICGDTVTDGSGELNSVVSVKFDMSSSSEEVYLGAIAIAGKELFPSLKGNIYALVTAEEEFLYVQTSEEDDADSAKKVFELIGPGYQVGINEWSTSIMKQENDSIYSIKAPTVEEGGIFVSSINSAFVDTFLSTSNDWEIVSTETIPSAIVDIIGQIPSNDYNNLENIPIQEKSLGTDTIDPETYFLNKGYDRGEKNRLYYMDSQGNSHLIPISIEAGSGILIGTNSSNETTTVSLDYSTQEKLSNLKNYVGGRNIEISQNDTNTNTIQTTPISLTKINHFSPTVYPLGYRLDDSGEDFDITHLQLLDESTPIPAKRGVGVTNNLYYLGYYDNGNQDLDWIQTYDWGVVTNGGLTAESGTGSETNNKKLLRLSAETPSSDGTYALMCTVTNGVVTYSWQAVSGS